MGRKRDLAVLDAALMLWKENSSMILFMFNAHRPMTLDGYRDCWLAVLSTPDDGQDNDA